MQKPVAGLVSHTVEVTSGEVGVGQPATSVVDAANRRAARQAHSATHLVHAALRDTLGKTATQAGSLNRAGYMRFDFTWGQALSDATKSEIEEIANNAVRDNLEVTTRVMALDEAKSLGAMALFGEKYGDTVRMVDIGGPWSRELCARHARRLERRDRAHQPRRRVVGRRLEPPRRGARRARRVPLARRRARARVAADLDAQDAARPAARPHRRAHREPQGRREEDRRVRVEGARRPPAGARRDRRRRSARTAWSPSRSARRRPRTTSAASRSQVRDRLGAAAGVVALGAEVGGRPVVIVATNDAARAAGAKAGALAKAAATALGGGGGGRDDVAQGGGTDASALPAALAAVKDALGRVSGFRRGVRLGIDVGKARVGVARCDPDGLLATPVETVPRDDGSIARIVALVGEHSAIELLVGLPLNMQGEDTASTADAREFAAALAAASALPVRLVDERLSTVSAHAALRDSGRSQRSSRSIVDQVAAVVLLQQALDVEKSTGRPAGTPVSQEPA